MFGVFHYEQRRLENALVALEPFDVCINSFPIFHRKKKKEKKLTHYQLMTSHRSIGKDLLKRLKDIRIY